MLPDSVTAVYSELYTLTLPHMPTVEDGPECFRDRMDELRQKLERVAQLLSDANQSISRARMLMRAKRAENALSRRTPEALQVETEMRAAEDAFENLRYLRNTIVARKDQLRGGMNDLRTMGRLMADMYGEATSGVSTRERKTVSPTTIDRPLSETTEAFPVGTSYSAQDIEDLLGKKH